MSNILRLQETLVLTIGDAVADLKAQGFRHVRDCARPQDVLDSQGRPLPEVQYFQNYVILIPEGGETLRDTIAVNLGDELCRWAYLPSEPQNLPAVIAGAKRMWTDEVSRLSDVPESGAARVYRTGFAGLDDHGFRIVTPSFMPIVGPYGSGKSIFLRQLLVNLWRLHGWKFLLTAFEEKIKPRYQRDFRRHLIGLPEKDWDERQVAKADIELDEACVFLRRKRNTLLDVERLIDRIEYAVRVYGLKVVAIDPVNEIDHQVPKGMAKTDYIGQFIMRFKQLADDYDLLLICVLHPPKDSVEKRGQKSGILTLNDGADSANWGNKADIGVCIWRHADGPTRLHIDKLKDHETMGKPTMCELIYDAGCNGFSVGKIGYEHFLGGSDV